MTSNRRYHNSWYSKISLIVGTVVLLSAGGHSRAKAYDRTSSPARGGLTSVARKRSSLIPTWRPETHGFR